MGNRVHIIGCSSRSGTTLMNELMVTCFEFDGSAEHEHSIFREYDPAFKTFCSKRPIQAEVVGPLLAMDENLWVIYMLRDPRDVVSSCSHRKNEGTYMGNFGLWLSQQKASLSLNGVPRFITIKYEELVTNPNKVQYQLMREIPFLKKRSDFSKYHVNANSSQKSIEALNGLRPISSKSVGSWENHKPQVVANINRYGDMSNELIKLGYEADKSWEKKLENVEPNIFPATLVDKGLRKRISKKTILYKEYTLYWLNTFPVINKYIYKIRSNNDKKYKFIYYL